MPHLPAPFNQEIHEITTNGPGPTLDISDYNHAGESMNSVTMTVSRTGGSTDAVNIVIQISPDGTTWATIKFDAAKTVLAGMAPLSVTTFVNNNPALASYSGPAFCYARYYVLTVGAGNTLTIHLIASRM